jgi:hypothetical protein
MESVIQIAVFFWLAAHLCQSQSTNNRFILLFMKFARPVLKFFSMEATWGMFCSGKEYGWTLRERLEQEVETADGKKFLFREIYDGGYSYHLFAVRDSRANHLHKEHVRFIVDQCKRMGHSPVKVNIITLSKNRPEPHVPFWSGRYKHEEFTNTPWTRTILASFDVRQNQSQAAA